MIELSLDRQEDVLDLIVPGPPITQDLTITDNSIRRSERVKHKPACNVEEC